MFEAIKKATKKIFERNSEKKYVVYKCPGMPSLVGMITVGKPEVGKDSIFMGAKGQYRTITPIKILTQEEEELEVYTAYLFANLRRAN